MDETPPAQSQNTCQGFEATLTEKAILAREAIVAWRNKELNDFQALWVISSFNPVPITKSDIRYAKTLIDAHPEWRA